MVWNSLWPDGAQSVKTNQATGAANTTYIETEMNKDHYWKISGNNDGHHQWVQMTQSGTAAVPVDEPLATGMSGIIYSKAKSEAEVDTGNQDVQPFFTSNKTVDVPGTSQVMQLLGMRACCLFTGRDTDGFCTIKYNHNVTSVERTAIGQYDIIFADTLPSVNYLVQGGGVRTATTAKHIVLFGIRTPTALLSEVKTDGTMKAITTRPDDNLTDVIQGWFYCFGG